MHSNCGVKGSIIMGQCPEEKLIMLYLYFRAMNWVNERKESGQGLVEYALIIVLIAVLLIAALMLLKDEISGAFSKITSGLAK